MLSMRAYTPQLNSAVKGKARTPLSKTNYENTFCRCNDIGKSKSTVIGEGQLSNSKPDGVKRLCQAGV